MFSIKTCRYSSKHVGQFAALQLSRQKSSSADFVPLNQLNPKSSTKGVANKLTYKDINSIAASPSTSLNYMDYLPGLGKAHKKLFLTNEPINKYHILKTFHEAHQTEVYKLCNILETMNYDKTNLHNVTIALSKLVLSLPLGIKSYTDFPQHLNKSCILPKKSNETLKPNDSGKDIGETLEWSNRDIKYFVDEFIDKRLFKDKKHLSQVNPLDIYEVGFLPEKAQSKTSISVSSKLDVHFQIQQLLVDPIINLVHTISGDQCFSFRSYNSTYVLYPDIIVQNNTSGSTAMIFQIKQSLPHNINKDNIDSLPAIKLLKEQLKELNCYDGCISDGNTFIYLHNIEDPLFTDMYVYKIFYNEDIFFTIKHVFMSVLMKSRKVPYVSKDESDCTSNNVIDKESQEDHSDADTNSHEEYDKQQDYNDTNKNSQEDCDDIIDEEEQEYNAFRKRLLNKTELPDLEDLFYDLAVPENTYETMQIPNKEIIHEFDLVWERDFQNITMKTEVFRSYFEQYFELNSENWGLNSIIDRSDLINIRVYDPIRCYDSDEIKEYLYEPFDFEYTWPDIDFDYDLEQLMKIDNCYPIKSKGRVKLVCNEEYIVFGKVIAVPVLKSKEENMDPFKTFKKPE
ncbi:hypothetical protein BN7_2265 [Wickerhamomyces ciferrii]|uniref:Uncharacterized protein n=1 Tax=Wickerhamomyces ciferrii (strain ATCC 14091 / BCRC 22168 / CBS 111 / JCM 3599 / NBRC 0793 / NRRL Y-1031 F-60-10) TaxID=1206466 RepID=K0KI93_WICCF|nr:uncharacterized protein BN7_2265 [Wickerhamomyces ciferrii]CCH42721.1 hypothetical protein BN7_2265 [Wickerhamomyces ciferrii]